VRNLKADIISVLLEKSNVMNGSNVILVDDSAGILSFAVLDRIGDSGEVLFVTNSEGVDQGLPNLKYYPRPLPKHHSLSWTNIRAGVLGNEYWEDLDKKIEETNAKITENEVAMEEQTEENNPPGQPKRMKTYTDRQKAMKKSKEFVENSRIDALIISSNYSCDGILDVFGKYLSPSRLLIIHANYVEELYDTYMRLRNDKNYINVNISENFTRYYQIYPKRTHAENNMTSATGFILTAIKVDGSKSVCVDDLMG
jgi:tRNA (adenine-N(1)-)-methyltransferase non-catalytic subunit